MIEPELNDLDHKLKKGGIVQFIMSDQEAQIHIPEFTETIELYGRTVLIPSFKETPDEWVSKLFSEAYNEAVNRNAPIEASKDEDNRIIVKFSFPKSSL